MKKSYLSVVLFSLLAGVLLISFQNCGAVKFSNQEVLESLSTVDPSDPGHPLSCSIGVLDAQTDVGGEPLLNPTVDQNAWGFELSNSHQSRFSFVPNGGVLSKDTDLYIEIATYDHPDSFKILYDTAEESGVVVFDVCNLATDDAAVKTHLERPEEDVIFQFGKFTDGTLRPVTLPEGVTRVHFVFDDIVSGVYIGVWGLDEFSDQLAPFSDLEVWKAFVSPAPTARMPGDENQNESGSSANSRICDPLKADGVGRYGCYGPGNFRLHSGGIVPVFN